MKSCVGVLRLKAKQAERLGLKSRSQLSPLLEKCCLGHRANESYQSAEAEIEALTGVKVGHSTQQRLVNRQDLPLPEARQAVSEVSVDGGKVRLRGALGEGSKRARRCIAVRIHKASITMLCSRKTFP